ncbi:MAG: UbiA family prenyltransferase [Victivallales bacterium]|jgi:4-hydroxybenzoate polyprenyltransferase
MKINTADSLLKFKAWLFLIRFPNLFTVPGDAVFAYLVMNGKIDSPLFVFLILAVLSFYAFGLVTNDIADLETDMRERPRRPLPSGRISVRSAKFAAFAFGLSGLLLSLLCGKEAFLAGIILVMLIYGYNFRVKNVPFLGPASLALCRMMGLLLGLFAAHSRMLSSDILFPAVVFLVTYVFWISVSAQVEVEEGRRKTVLLGGWLIAVLAVLWIPAGFYFSSEMMDLMGEITPSICFAVTLSVILAASALKNILVLHLKYKTSKVPAFIGDSIRNLIIFQSSACAFAGFMDEASCLLLLFMPAWIFSKKFYQS